MTREKPIKYLTDILLYQNRDSYYRQYLSMAIKALEQIDKIERIIAIDNSVIQEDVLKYKMICEVIKR